MTTTPPRPDQEFRTAAATAGTEHMVVHGLDRLLTVQRPVVLAHLRALRRGMPHATGPQLVAALERRYLAAVTVGGAGVGASAAIPAVTTGVALALSAVETAGFLEASALFAQSVTEIHGIPVSDPDRARALVMAMVLGHAGRQVMSQFAAQAAGTGAPKTALWGEVISRSLPTALVGPLADALKRMFVTRFAATQGTNILGRLLPFGIGAVIGGGGNHLLGRAIVKASREAFGPAPHDLPPWLEPTYSLDATRPRRRLLPWRGGRGTPLPGQVGTGADTAASPRSPRRTPRALPRGRSTDQRDDLWE